MLPKFSYMRASTLEAAVSALSDGKNAAVIHAGGTDLLGCLREETFTADKVISISRLKALKGIEKTGRGGLRIGALATITEVAENPLVQEMYPVLAQAAAAVASPQLRNQGTIGGNLCQKPRCWYYRGEFHCLRKGGPTCFAAAGENQFHCIFGGDGVCFIVHPSDTAPALVALGASVVATGPEGRRKIPAAEFHVPPADDVTVETVLKTGEIVTDVILPPPPENLRSAYRKVRARGSWDFALAGAALALSFDGDVVTGGRVVLSGAAPVPWRSRPVEEAIMGKRIDDAVLDAAAEAVIRDASPLGKNGYKLPLFQGVIREELAALAGKAG